MKDLTIIILTNNEEAVIGHAINSVKEFAGEILVVDSNSHDNTVNIAKKAGAKVVSHQLKDFSDQRNFAMLHATTKWVMYLDADEKLTESFKEETRRRLRDFDKESKIGGFFINRKTYYYGKDWNFTDRVQRIFLREKFKEWKGVVHETPFIIGEYSLIKSPILHFTHRNISQMVKKTNDWSEYEAKLRFSASHPKLAQWRFVRVMGTEFFNSYIKNRGFKNGTYGLIEAIYQSFSIFITYAKLWEMQNKE